MAEPTSAKKLSDIILTVAKEIGLAYYVDSGEGIAVLPIDARDLQVCKDLVYDGFEMFEASQPPTGWNWKSRILSVTFDSTGAGSDNIDSDPARYQLDQAFSGVVNGKITYEAETNQSSMIDWVSEARIRTNRSVTVQTGRPRYAAIRPYGTRRYELIVDPQPGSNYTVEFPYLTHFDKILLETGIATSGSSTTLADTNRWEVDDYFNGWTLTILAGTGRGETATITDYAQSTGTLTFTALSGGSTPDTTSVYKLEEATGMYHPAGASFDHVVKCAALYKAELSDESIQDGQFKGQYADALQFAYVTDALQKGKARRLGKMTDGRARSNERIWNDVEFS